MSPLALTSPHYLEISAPLTGALTRTPLIGAHESGSTGAQETSAICQFNLLKPTA